MCWTDDVEGSDMERPREPLSIQVADAATKPSPQHVTDVTDAARACDADDTSTTSAAAAQLAAQDRDDDDDDDLSYDEQDSVGERSAKYSLNCACCIAITEASCRSEQLIKPIQQS